MVDCIVVGAGPAGGTTAYHLAKQGHAVLVLEKATLPRFKPCSGAVSPSIAQWFDFDFDPVIDRRIAAIRYTWKLDDPVNAKLKTSEPIWMVQRDAFDQFLIQKAQEKGAEIQDNTTVTGIKFSGDRWQVNTATGTFDAPYLVAADGANGPLANWLGLSPGKTRPAALLDIPVDAEAAQTVPISFEFGLLKNGCLWNFPKTNRYTLAACTFRGGDLKDKEAKAQLEKYASSFGASANQGTYYQHGLKLWDGNAPLHTQNALLAGEAAAVADPLTAEGIRPSILSGVRAAEAVAKALAGDPDAIAGYSHTMHNEWGEDMQWAQRIAGLFYRVPGIAYRVGIKRPTATQRLGQLLAGDIHYADVANRVTKRLSSSLIPGMGK
ncbi:MAG: geranylgeranyl reductase family protein [Cyanobacteria bacterium J06635_15]